MAPGGVRGARLHHRVRAGRTTRPAAPSAGSSSPRASRSPSACRSRSSPRPPRPRSGDHDENVDFDRAAEIVGDRPLLEELRRLSIALYEHAAEHALEAGIILADTKFEFGRRADGTIVLGDEACTPDSSRFWPADGYRPGGSQPSFDKQFVRDWAAGSGWDKAPPAPRHPGRGRRGHARALRGRLRADRRRAVRALARAGRRLTARVLIRPKQGILDPQGQAVERALPALGFEGVSNVRVGRMIELEVEDTGARARDVRAAAGQPLDRGLRGPGGRVRFGVVRFPGSCDEVDALQACARFGDAELLWHGDRDLRGVDVVVIPGGFSYGDYLRCGAIARFAPVMDAVSEHALGGGPVLGICNGFQVLCEAGLLPGALLPNAGRRFVCRQVDVEVVNASTPFTRACEAGDVLSIPVKHTTGRFYAPDEGLGELEAQGQVLLRYRDGPRPQRLRAGRRRRVQPGQERDGADAPPRARHRPAHRLQRRRPAVRVARGARRRAAPGVSAGTAERPPPRARAHRRRVRAHRRTSSAASPTGSSWPCSRSCGPSTAPTSTPRSSWRACPTEGPHLLMGPGENAGAVDVGRRAGDRLQGRVAQPPERGRALPGSGHRRRRDPARRVRRGRPPDRGARLAALRGAGVRALALPAGRRRVGHRALRQLDRRGHGGRRGVLRGARTSRTAS